MRPNISLQYLIRFSIVAAECSLNFDDLRLLVIGFGLRVPCLEYDKGEAHPACRHVQYSDWTAAPILCCISVYLREKGGVLSCLNHATSLSAPLFTKRYYYT